MLKTKYSFCFYTLTIIFLCTNFFCEQILANPTVDLDNPKEAKSKIKEEPDMLIPAPKTEKELKKEAKEAKKAAKKNNKKTKPAKFKKNKKIRKRSYRSVKSEITAPKTFDEYLLMAKDKKRDAIEPTPPSIKKDEKLVNIPDPDVRLIKYNNPPGIKDLDLRQLMVQHEINSKGVLSPDGTKLAYSVIYSYPTSEQVATELFYIKIPEETEYIYALKNFHTISAEREPVLKSGTERLFQYEKRTFTIIDWSEDGKKIAVKEKIGAQTKGPWKTQIWTYDFENKKSYELTALREAIRYYWKNEHKLDLIDYMWDIYPIGWDLYNPDRIISYAYAYGKDKKGSKFLGTWSIDFQNQRSELMSETGTDFDVSVNGFCLEFKRGE